MEQPTNNDSPAQDIMTEQQRLESETTHVGISISDQDNVLTQLVNLENKLDSFIITFNEFKHQTSTTLNVLTANVTKEIKQHLEPVIVQNKSNEVRFRELTQEMQSLSSDILNMVATSVDLTPTEAGKTGPSSPATSDTSSLFPFPAPDTLTQPMALDQQPRGISDTISVESSVHAAATSELCSFWNTAAISVCYVNCYGRLDLQ